MPLLPLTFFLNLRVVINAVAILWKYWIVCSYTKQDSFRNEKKNNQFICTDTRAGWYIHPECCIHNWSYFQLELPFNVWHQISTALDILKRHLSVCRTAFRYFWYVQKHSFLYIVICIITLVFLWNFIVVFLYRCFQRFQPNVQVVERGADDNVHYGFCLHHHLAFWFY